uniref:SEC7 domain-containing protein n=2 Tax=Haptolina ericina TaxID=156174 RepID=A0A7S3AEG1_9EUKA|mmetsp:Transcript_14792/g.33160  ORF Transcript_14792/g.33160 Transcript_14792/m.33160 type:complete len:353 (+) Transcript_14792:326-1384(+)
MVWLETSVRTALAQNVQRGLALLEQRGVLPSSVPQWGGTVHCLLGWMPLAEKRRLASFVCADWQPAEAFIGFFQPLQLVAASPEGGLRALLLHLPFLPIDAGEGADRVISAFARGYVTQNPARCRVLLQPTEEDPFGGDERGGTGVGGAEEVSGEGDSSGPCGGAQFERDAQDTVHLLVYSIIMLNTDLHNPAIHPKMSAREYAASCLRCPQLRRLPTASFEAIHASITESPLQIASNVASVDTILRTYDGTGAIATPAQYSVYSSFGQPSRGNVAGAGAGGAPLSGVQPSASLPAVDWAVAYYNILDMLRDLRRSFSHRWLPVARGRQGMALLLGATFAAAAAVLLCRRHS